MAGTWERDAIQALGKKWAELKRKGAPEDVLLGIHNQAEALRRKEGYSGGGSGNKYIGVITNTSKPDPVEVIGSAEDLKDDKFEVVDFGSSATGSMGTGGNILGYVILCIVSIAILDKVMG